jgi:hypothetical protein
MIEKNAAFDMLDVHVESTISARPDAPVIRAFLRPGNAQDPVT